MAAAAGWTVVSKDTPLLSEVLRELGYWTALVGKFHFNPRTCVVHNSGGGFGCGFDQQYGFIGGMSDYYNHHATWGRDGVAFRERGYATDLFGAEAERLVLDHAKLRSNTSLFLWMALTAPHTPLQAAAQ